MATKRNPGQFDCYEKAHPDEPMFILLGRDQDAPVLVRLWASLRQRAGERQEKVAEALACARSMDDWRRGKNPASEPATFKTTDDAERQEAMAIADAAVTALEQAEIAPGAQLRRRLVRLRDRMRAVLRVDERFSREVMATPTSQGDGYAEPSCRLCSAGDGRVEPVACRLVNILAAHGRIHSGRLEGSVETLERIIDERDAADRRARSLALDLETSQRALTAKAERLAAITQKLDEYAIGARHDFPENRIAGIGIALAELRIRLTNAGVQQPERFVNAVVEVLERLKRVEDDRGQLQALVSAADRYLTGACVPISRVSGHPGDPTQTMSLEERIGFLDRRWMKALDHALEKQKAAEQRAEALEHTRNTA